MVVMLAIPSIVLTNMLCSVGRLVDLVPIRAMIVHDVENRVYSKNWVTVDILVNLLTVAVSAVALVRTAAEKPNVPVRVWLVGYLVQCLIHVVLVWFEYRRLAKRSEVDLEAAGNGIVGDNDYNAVVVFFWTRARLTMMYQRCDVIFALVFVAVIVVCFIFSFGLRNRNRNPVPRQKQEGASEADLTVLPKYRFHMSSNAEKPSDFAGVLMPMDTSSGDLATECGLLPEDAECCICLGSYDDGIELHVLPCNHHFHSTCIVEWLKINAICPICNHSILKGSA